MDQIWDSLLTQHTGTVKPVMVVLYLLLSFVLSQLVAWVYMWTHRGISYSRSHVQSLVLLCLIVTLVMLAIGNNLARAFGLFGALALIRFRTPVKDVRDTVFLFFSVAIGIAIGTHNIAIAVAGTLFFVVLSLYLDRIRFGSRISHNAVLRFESQDSDETALQRVLRAYCRHFSLMNLQDEGESVSLAYQLRLFDPSGSRSLVAELQELDGVGGVRLHIEDEDMEV